MPAAPTDETWQVGDNKSWAWIFLFRGPYGGASLTLARDDTMAVIIGRQFIDDRAPAVGGLSSRHRRQPACRYRRGSIGDQAQLFSGDGSIQAPIPPSRRQKILSGVVGPPPIGAAKGQLRWGGKARAPLLNEKQAVAAVRGRNPGSQGPNGPRKGRFAKCLSVTTRKNEIGGGLWGRLPRPPAAD